MHFLGGEEASHVYKTLTARNTKGWEGAISARLAWLLLSGRGGRRAGGQEGISAQSGRGAAGSDLTGRGRDGAEQLCRLRASPGSGLPESADVLDVGSRGQGICRLACKLLPTAGGRSTWRGQENNKEHFFSNFIQHHLLNNLSHLFCSLTCQCLCEYCSGLIIVTF